MTEQQSTPDSAPGGDHPIIDSTTTQGEQPPTHGDPDTGTPVGDAAAHALSGEETGSADGTVEEVPEGEGDTSGDTVEGTALAGDAYLQGGDPEEVEALEDLDMVDYGEEIPDETPVRVPNVRPGAVSGLDHTPLA